MEDSVTGVQWLRGRMWDEAGEISSNQIIENSVKQDTELDLILNVTKLLKGPKQKNDMTTYGLFFNFILESSWSTILC